MSRTKHPQKDRRKEPWIRWKWQRYPNDEFHTEKPDHREIREARELKAERETDRDLSKSIPQLVADFNVVVERIVEKRKTRGSQEQKRDAGQEISEDMVFLLLAQRRMVAMMAQVALKHKRMAGYMLWLTIAILVLTGVTVWKDISNKSTNRSVPIATTVQTTQPGDNKEVPGRSRDHK
jgi:hypothetical protein